MHMFVTSWFICGFGATLISRFQYGQKVKVWYFITTTVTGYISLVWILAMVLGWSRLDSMITSVMEYEI